MSQQSLDTFEAEFDVFRRRHDAAVARYGARIGATLFHRWLAFEHRTAGNRRAPARNFLKAAADGRRLSNLACRPRAPAPGVGVNTSRRVAWRS